MGADYSSRPAESNAGAAAKTPRLDDKAAMSGARPLDAMAPSR